MNLLISTRDLEFGVGNVIKNDLKNFDKNKSINQIILVGPNKLEGYSNNIKFEIIKNIGRLFITKEPNFAFKCNLKIKDILKNKKIDKIITHYPFFANKYKSILIYRAHGLHKSIIKNHPIKPQLLISAFFHYLYSYFDYRTIKYSDEVHFVSRGTMEEAKTFYPQFAHKFK